MASPAAVLSVLVKAQGIQQTQRSLQTLDKSAKKTQGTFSKFAGIAKGAAGLAGIGGLAVGLKTMNDEYREAQKTGAQTNAVLKSTKGAANVTRREIESLAGAISKKTGIDDEQIQASENMLLTFTKLRNETGKGNDIFNQATQTVTDMSVALGQSGKASAIQLGKALNDPIKGVTALRRVGVSFTAEQQKQIETMVKSGDRLGAQKLILRELRTEFQGSAAAQATAGDKLKVSLGNLAEAAGGILVPALDKVAVGVTKVIDDFVKGEGIAKFIIPAFTALATVVGELAGMLGQRLQPVFAAVAYVGLNMADALNEIWATSNKLTVLGKINASFEALSSILRETGTAGRVLATVLDAVRAAVTVTGQGVIALVTGFQQGKGWAVALGSAIIGLTAAVVAYRTVVLVTTAATRAWAAAQALLNAVLTANPIGLVIAALGALAVALVVAYKKSETFRNVVNAIGTAIRNALITRITQVLGVFSTFLGAISKVAGALGRDGLARKAAEGQRAIDDLRNSLNNVPSKKDVEVAVRIKLDGQNVDVSKAKPLSPTPPGGDGPGVIGSEIADKVRASKNVHDRAKKLVADGIGALIPGIGSGKVGSLMGANSSLAPFAALGAKFGLHVSSGKRAAGGRTVSGGISYHGSGQAIDLANGAGPDAAKLSAFRALKSRYGSQLAELIYTPGGVGIKNGQPFRYTGAVAAQHMDHVHVAFTGAQAGGGRNQAFTGDGPGSLSGINLAIDAARKAGFTGEALVRMVAIAGRESNYNPGAQNLKPPDHSIGLWQINQLAHHGRFGTDAQLKNPYTNARAAWILSGHGHNFNPWSTNRGLSAALIKRARAAVAAFGGATSTGGAGNSAGGGGAASGAAGAVSKVNPFDQKIASADLAIQQAQTGKASTRTFQQVAAMVAKRKLIGKRITSIRKALKGKLSPGKRLALTQELTQRLQEHAQLGTDIQGLVHPAATVGGGDGGSIGDVGDPNQALIDSNEALQAKIDEQIQAEKEHTDALNAVKDEVKRQTDFAASATTSTNFQAWKSLADIMSGQIVGKGVNARAATPGYGVEYRS